MLDFILEKRLKVQEETLIIMPLFPTHTVSMKQCQPKTVELWIFFIESFPDDPVGKAARQQARDCEGEIRHIQVFVWRILDFRNWILDSFSFL